MAEELDELPVLKKKSDGGYDAIYTSGDELPVLKKKEPTSGSVEVSKTVSTPQSGLSQGSGTKDSVPTTYQWSGGEVNMQPTITTPSEKTQKETVNKIQPTPKKQTEIGAVEGVINAIDRGWKQGKVADILAMGRTPTKDELREIARLQKEQQQIKPTASYEKFNNAESGTDALKTFIQNPLEIASQLSLESLSALARHGWNRAAVGAGMGGAIGTVVPVLGTAAGLSTGYIAGIGVAGYNLEVAGSILESLGEAGVDVTNEQSLIDGFEDEAKLKTARQFAMKRGVPIAAFDIVTAGIAGKLLGKPTRTILGKLGQTAVEVGIQMAGAGAGEATAQMVSSGKIKPTQILAEMIGEVGGGASDIVVGTIVERAKAGEPTKSEMIKSKMDAKEFDDLIDISEASGEIDEQTADNLKEEYRITQKVNATIPDNQKGNEEIYDLVERKQTLKKSLDKLDPAFASGVEEEIKAIEEEIKIKSAIPLTSKERTELNNLQTAKDSNTDYDKVRLKELEARQKAVQKADEEAKAEEAKKVVEVRNEQETELADFAKERSVVKDLYDQDWDGKSDDEIVYMQERRAALEEKEIEIFEKYATDEEKKKLEKLGKQTIIEKLKGETFFPRKRSEDYKEAILERITEGVKATETAPVQEETKVVEAQKKTDETVEVELEPTVTEEKRGAMEVEKPTPQKVNVLGKEVNMYNDYIPSKIEDVEPNAMYVFNANSKDGIPSLLQDIAYANKRDVNGVKTENWHASISGDELLKLYPSQSPTDTKVEAVQTPTETVTEAEVVTPIAPDVSNPLADVESTAKALEGKDKVVNTPIKGLSVRMTDLRIAEENLSKGKKSVTPNAPVDVRINLTTGERELADGYHRYLDARGGTIENAKNTNIEGSIPANIKFEVNEKSGGFTKTRDATIKEVSEAYHKAKADGSNPELVSAVEGLLSKEQTPIASEGAGEGAGKPKTWGKLTKMPHQEGKGVEIDNAPDGNFINVGLQIGQTTELIPEGDVASNLPKDVKILSQTKMVDDFGEPFLSLELSRPLTKAELLKLQEATQQLDIPQLSGKKGTMYGTQQYGLFDPTKMTLPDGTRLSNATTTSSTTKNNFKPNKVLTGANKIISGIADAYKKANRLFSKTPRLVTKVSDVDGKRIADAFNEMKHEPNNPEVKKGFEQLITEIKKQADALIKEGFKFELVTEGKAYNSDSKKMLNDVKNNKRILIEASEGAFGTKRTFDQDNIGLQDSGYTDVNGRKLTNVELIRAVHDLFGHSEYGNGFGAIGEENAWRVHMSMFTPLAQKALTATTRGQNSWVNFGNHMRNADGSIKKKGDAGYLEPNKRPFAEQKIGFLPDWAMENAYGDRVTVNGKEIKPTNKYVVDGKEAYEIDDAQAFFDAISSAKESRGDDGIQVALKTKEEYQKVLDEGGVLLVSKDGKVGVMLEANGNVGSGFAHADLPKGENSLKPLLITAIKLGGRFTDAYDGYLPKYYSRFGFKPSFRMKFNPEFADKGWEKTILKNEPDVVFMYFDGNRETLEADYNKFPDYDNTKGEYVTDYDKAVEATKAKSIELEDQASLTPPPDAKAGATKQEAPKTEPKVEQATEQVQKFKDVLDQRTDKKTDKALKAFGEQAEKAKELIDNYDTNLKKLEEKGVEVKGTKTEILADMLDGKYDEALKSDTSIPSSKTEVPKGKTTETPKTKLQTAKEKLAEAKRKRDELAKKKGNLGAFKDSFGEAEEQAKADRELFDAYVDFAKEYISEVGGTIQDWAKEINEEVDENLKRAWDLANSKGGVKKTVLTTRVYEGDTREEVRKEIEKFGLNRDRIPHAEAEANAKKLIEQVGLDMAYQATINGDIVGGSAAEVYAAKIRDLNEQINSAKTTEEIEILSKDLAAVYSRFSNVATEAGQFGSQLGYIYDRDSDLGYNYEKKIKEYKDANNGEIPAEIAAKFKELDDQIKELSKQIKEAENKAQKASEQQAVDEIKASIKRNPTANKKAKAKRLMSEGLDDIAQALGVQLMASGTKRASVVTGLTKIGQSLILNGEATIENVGEKVREFVKTKFGDKLNFDDFATDFDLAMLPEESDNKLKIPNSYIRGLVEDGIDNIDDLVKAIQKDYSGTEREIRDAITGYGKTFKIGDDIAKEINRMKDIGRMISALEDIEKGQRPLKSGQQREAPTVEQREMRKKVREALKELGVDEATMEKQLKTSLDAAKTRLSNQIEDMEAEIAKGEQVPKSARTMRSDKELDDLKAKRDEVKKRYDEMFKDEAYKEAKRLEMTKRATERRIEALKNKLKNEDFDKKPKKLLIEDTELTKLRAEKIRLQDEYDKEIQKAELRNRTKVEVWKDKAWEAWGITRALSATGEWSFVGVQGLTQLISNPSNSYKAAKTAWSMMWSEKKSDEFLSNLRAQDFYPIMKQSKLAITEPNSKITAREELFNSQWTNIAWGVLGSPLKLKSESAYEGWLKANPFKALERASVGYLDTIRVLRFLDGVQMLEMKGKNYNENQQAYKDMADVVNTLTGRASIGKLEGFSEELSKVFFSPRNWASGLKTTILLPRQVYKWQKDSGTKEVSVANKIALGDLSKMMGLTTSMVMLAAAGLGSDGDDETSVGSDPTSSDFGKIIIGNRRIDPWGGKIQQIVFASRMILDSITKGGETKRLGQGIFTPTKFDLITQQATNKLAPSAGLLVNYMKSNVDRDGMRKLYGKEYSFKNELGEVMRPIYLNTVIDLLKDDPTALDGMLLFYGFFGGGIGVQEDKKKKDRPRGIVN